MVESQRVRNLLVFTLWDSPPSYFLTDFPSNCICSFMVWVRCPRERRHTFNPTIGTNLGREKGVRNAGSCGLKPQTWNLATIVLHPLVVQRRSRSPAVSQSCRRLQLCPQEPHPTLEIQEDLAPVTHQPPTG